MHAIRTMLKQSIPSGLIRQTLDVDNCILFTFDDGPHPTVTPRVLDVLDRHGVRGLFFVIGKRCDAAPEVLDAIVERRHGLGNHSFAHVSCRELAFEDIVADVRSCHDLLRRRTGQETNLYRPPYGDINPALLWAARRCKQKVIRWSFDAGEYSYLKGASAQVLADNLVKTIHDSAIVLMHDDNEVVPDCLDLALPALIDRGIDLSGGLDSLQ